MNYDVAITRTGTTLFGQSKNPTIVPEIHEPQNVEVQTGDLTNSTLVTSDREKSPKTSDASTPSRNRGNLSSSRLISAITQFYGNGEDDNNEDNQTAGQVKTVLQQQTRMNSATATATSDESFPEIKGRVESKLMSMWHNVKYGWNGKIRSSFSKEQPVWLLGRCYHRKCSLPSSMESSAEMTSSLENKLFINDHQQQHLEGLQDPTVHELATDAIEGENHWEEGIEGFKRDFYSRMWMTYRREFPIMNGSNYTSDCGWGCMLRSGQMLLAQALICHFLGRNWRWDPDTQLFSTHEDHIHRKIIRWFGDSSSKNSPFSIHTLVTLGQETGKKPGDWYGPASVSHLLKQAVKLASQENADFDDLRVYVAQDCTVYIQDILDECLVPDRPIGPIAPWQQQPKKSPPGNRHDEHIKMQWKALILLVPLRLGTEKLNSIYGNSLKTLLSTEYCIGVIGGRPKHSLYFVGFQEDKLIHLDPHYCQEVVDVNQENFSVNSFHCKSPRKLKLSKLDPCCCIGFYCPTKVDFDNFVASVQPYLLPARTQASSSTSTSERSSSPNLLLDNYYPMFVFSRSRRCDQQSEEELPESLYKPLQMQLRSMKLSPCSNQQTTTTTTDDDDDDETEEFVIL